MRSAATSTRPTIFATCRSRRTASKRSARRGSRSASRRRWTSPTGSFPPRPSGFFASLAVFPADFDAAAAAAVCSDEGNAQLGTLFRYSLVEFGQQEGRYRLHDLTRLFAAARLDDPAHGGERLPAEGRHAAHFRRLLAAADELYLKGNENIAAGVALFDRERANIEAGQAWSAAHAETSDAAARLANDYPNAGVYVLDLRLHPRQRIEWLLAAVAASRRLKDRRGRRQPPGQPGHRL